MPLPAPAEARLQQHIPARIVEVNLGATERDQAGRLDAASRSMRGTPGRGLVGRARDGVRLLGKGGTERRARRSKSPAPRSRRSPAVESSAVGEVTARSRNRRPRADQGRNSTPRRGRRPPKTPRRRGRGRPTRRPKAAKAAKPAPRPRTGPKSPPGSPRFQGRGQARQEVHRISASLSVSGLERFRGPVRFDVSNRRR